ncbi:ribosomal protein S30 [Arctopsyche grandis]|uniref:ribosomal protein S30 n=1 Tax=Arctopsyche grandis TaxID=121162 RepID=UPI00406D98BA
MQLHVRGQEVHVVEAAPEWTVAALKEHISSLTNSPANELCLSCNGAPLTDDFSVSELTSAELDLTIPLLGGKVHGSLARAGKVKGQTPKVEKQEKKKKKTGRAKRRIQYNRRFVNIVQTYGRRRGPNANSA